MAEYLLYGLNDRGEAVYCELLRDREREVVVMLARTRLRDWSEVEVWEGPVRVLRLRRPAATSSEARNP